MANPHEIVHAQNGQLDILRTLDQCMGEDELQCIVTRLHDGVLVFALVCRAFRDAVHRRQGAATNIQSTSAQVHCVLYASILCTLPIMLCCLIVQAVTSVSRLRWALSMGCPHASICADAAAQGLTEVLVFAR